MRRKRSQMNLYHVIVRGVDRVRLFYDDTDYLKYISLLKEGLEGKELDLYAVCLMGNHAHFLLGVRQAEGDFPDISPMSALMYRTNTLYARYYNKKYERTGPLFGGRYKSVAVFCYKQMWDVLRYIYRNPEKASLCKDWREYEWSSYGFMQFFGIKIALMPDIMRPKDEDAFFNEKNESLHLERRDYVGDNQAIAILKSMCGSENANAIGRLPMAKQREILREANQTGFSVSCLSRVSGLSRGVINRLLGWVRYNKAEVATT